MSSNEHIIKNLDELDSLASEKIKTFSKGSVVGLDGDLGAGKTSFLKALISKIIKIHPDEISSPTFALHHIYQNKEQKVHHLDLYRLENIEELESLGLDELLTDGSIVFMEWADRFPELNHLFTHRIQIQAHEGIRTFKFSKVEA